MDTSETTYEGVWAGDIVETVHGPGTVSSVAEGGCWIELPEHSLRWFRRILDVRVIDRDPAIERKQAIKRIVETRRIQFLTHFTSIENVLGILTFGLLPRVLLGVVRNAGLKAVVTDEDRLDLCSHASSLSISFPNYRMFYKYRTAMKGKTWAVLKISPVILWEKECVFCGENAASSRVRNLSITSRKGPEALQKLFQDYQTSERSKERAILKLPDGYPTHPQAEVLAFGTVEPKFLLQVCFESPEDLDYACIAGDHASCNVPFMVDKDLYLWRKDHYLWEDTARIPYNEDDIPF